MRRPLIHQLAILTAVLALLSMVTGAFVTNEKLPAGQQWQVVPEIAHRIAGEAALVLALVAAGGIFGVATLRGLRGFAAAAVVFGLADGFTSGMPILHAFLAQLFFAPVACLALCSSAAWEKGAEPLDAKRWPALVPLGTIAPLLVVGQVSLGAAYRHKAFGVLPHMGGALLVALTVLGLCVFVMQNVPENRSLNRAAALALTVTLIQVMLGVGVFVTGLLDADTTHAALSSAAAHVTTGALTLAAASYLAIQIRRGAAAFGGV